MTPLALGFMALSWAFVLGLTAWTFWRVLRKGSTDAPRGDERRD